MHRPPFGLTFGHDLHPLLGGHGVAGAEDSQPLALLQVGLDLGGDVPFPKPVLGALPVPFHADLPSFVCFRLAATLAEEYSFRANASGHVFFFSINIFIAEIISNIH